jgi:hypothetical protein
MRQDPGRTRRPSETRRTSAVVGTLDARTPGEPAAVTSESSVRPAAVSTFVCSKGRVSGDELAFKRSR